MSEAPTPSEIAGAARRPPRPLHRRISLLLLVFVGGACGTALRAWLEVEFTPESNSWPWVTFAINASGSLLLGFLLEALTRGGADEGWRRYVRVGVGTGAIGGFTTYSTFVVEVDLLARAGHVGISAAYAAASIVVGLVCALAGILAARAVIRPTWHSLRKAHQ